MPHGSHALTATVYAKDARRLAAFYAEVLGLMQEEQGASFVVLASEGIALAELGADDTMPA